jgi:hypothetical protein
MLGKSDYSKALEMSVAIAPMWAGKATSNQDSSHLDCRCR